MATGKNDDQLEILPKVEAMKRKVLRQRENISEPKNPEKRTDFDIPEEYTRYLDEHFLRVDTGSDDPERILIFVTDRGLMDMKKYRHYCSDGTFKSRPKIFHQILMIHVCINETQAAPRYVFLFFNKIFIKYKPVFWFVLFLLILKYF